MIDRKALGFQAMWHIGQERFVYSGLLMMQEQRSYIHVAGYNIKEALWCYDIKEALRCYDIKEALRCYDIKEALW